MKTSLAVTAGLAAAIAAGAAHANSPPIADANGREYCKAEITSEMKEQIGLSYFQRSDRQNTAAVKTLAKRLSQSILNCLDHVDAAIDKQKDRYSPEDLARIRTYVSGRRASAEEDFYQAMIRAGYRPSSHAPQRYTVCEYRMEFHHPEHYVTVSGWSPVFFDREADNHVPMSITGRPVTKTAADVIEELRKWARSNYKPFIAEFASCDQFDRLDQASTWRSERLKGKEDHVPANITLPPSARSPIV